MGLLDAENKVRGFSGLSMLIMDEASCVSGATNVAALSMLVISDGDRDPIWGFLRDLRVKS